MPPATYVWAQIKEMNEEYHVGRVTFHLTADFNEKVKHTAEQSSASNWMNIGYFFLQDLMKDLNLKEFFQPVTSHRKITYDCFTISRFLTYARILDPRSKHATWDRLASYYEPPDFDYQHISEPGYTSTSINPNNSLLC